ncbi:glycosyltransferase involved in cell wall biosynthesis [Bacillus sp. SLBN-46]|uniref:glycosyltransferase family 2 protein n=1 Tax=Bacillus sp. SLBN-46 TaxID=3042283 RepID=UPI00285F2F03|nr:glycosyltransferase [Bacillus sp. SLBN-46]MDR6121913.1 glycosyltransferase involved in cell wall biosynthesis [Bacillus sp. SLBN-46]
MENKISIIVPIYKVQECLNKCIDSILNQSFQEFELILVNDGSPDRCGEICEDYAKKDKRVKVIHKVNGGLSSARNTGIDYATGDFIAFVDSDDYINSNMYELLYKKAIETSADIVLCDFDLVYENENNKDANLVTNLDFVHQTFTNIEALEELYGNRNVNFVVAWNKLYRRSLFSDLRYEEGRIHEDEFIIHKLLYKSSKITYLPIKLYFYFQRNNSITGTTFSLKRLDEVYALRNRVDFFKKVKLQDLQHKAEFKYMESLFVNYRKVKINKLNTPNEFMNIKKDLFNSLIRLIQNPFNNRKEKTIWTLFITFPFIYDWYKKVEHNKKNSL